LPNGHDIEQIKQEFLSNGQPEPCSSCWYNELQGLVSKRIQDNRYILRKLEQDLDQAVANIRQTSVVPRFHQLTLSNLCNQACATCNGSASTKWISLETASQYQHVDKNLDDVNIDYEQALRISFSGGEPLYDPLTYQCLERLIAAGNTDCEIVIITNGSQPIRGRHAEILAKFNKVNAVVSIDGTGGVFEYLRWPGQWPNLVNNLKEYEKIFNHVSVSYTISTLNILYHEDTINWFEEQKLKFNYNIVHQPKWASPKYMPVELKQKLVPGTFAHQFATISGEEIDLREFLRELDRQDSLKHISVHDHLPRLTEACLTNQSW
jgi:hypothetical protein